jgi:hypothetical protein
VTKGEHSDLGAKYGVESIPALIFVNSGGDEIDTMSDREPTALAEQIESVASGAAERNRRVRYGAIIGGIAAIILLKVLLSGKKRRI